MFYLLACINNLKAGISLYPSITIAIGILESLEAVLEEEANVLTAKKALELMESQLGLIDLILADITQYDH
jgi:hypothetical protein